VGRIARCGSKDAVLGIMSRGTQSKDDPFGFLQVTLDQKGEGSGQIMAAAEIRFDKKKGACEIESYGKQYAEAVNVRPLR
jgi:hypothetical protein